MARKKKSMAELERPTIEEFHRQPKIQLSLVLDNIRSANNVGSMFRTADGFALAHVYLCGITATPPHRDILKTALGATQSVAWSHHASATELVRTLSAQGTRVLALEQTENALPLRGLQSPTPLAVVVGNEVQGVQQEVIDVCDGTIEIAQFGTKHSLNVAVAAALVLYELAHGVFRISDRALE